MFILSRNIHLILHKKLRFFDSVTKSKSVELAKVALMVTSTHLVRTHIELFL